MFTLPEGTPTTCGQGRQQVRSLRLPFQVGHPDNRVEMATTVTCGTEFPCGRPGMTTKI